MLQTLSAWIVCSIKNSAKHCMLKEVNWDHSVSDFHRFIGI